MSIQVEDKNEIEGAYETWEWCHVWKSYVFQKPLRIYHQEDGKFTVSSGGVWHEGTFNTFEDAEKEALGAE